MFNNQGNSKPEASQKENGDMAWACCEELVELDDVQLATVVGGRSRRPNHSGDFEMHHVIVGGAWIGSRVESVPYFVPKGNQTIWGTKIFTDNLGYTYNLPVMLQVKR